MYFQLSSYKKRKQMEKHDYEEWKSSVLAHDIQKKEEGIYSVFVPFFLVIIIKPKIDIDLCYIH